MLTCVKTSSGIDEIYLVVISFFFHCSSVLLSFLITRELEAFFFFFAYVGFLKARMEEKLKDDWQPYSVSYLNYHRSLVSSFFCRNKAMGSMVQSESDYLTYWKLSQMLDSFIKYRSTIWERKFQILMPYLNIYLL